MKDARDLLPRFLQDYPFQPATAFWRAVEIAAVLENGVPPGRGLDVGCGDGLLTAIINENLDGRREWVGIDPDPHEVELARKSGLYSECLVAYANQLPMASDSFDFAISNSVLEHIQDLSPVLDEVARVLKPHGQFIFTVPSDTFHSALRGPLLPGQTREEYLSAIDARCSHLRYWGEDAWRRELDRAGLSVISATRYLDLNQTRRWETLSRFTAGLLYALSGEKKKPIEIQRRLGLRKFGQRLPRPLAFLAAKLMSSPLGTKRTETAPYACLLIVSQKR